jgi:hypothetical protein
MHTESVCETTESSMKSRTPAAVSWCKLSATGRTSTADKPPRTCDPDANGERPVSGARSPRGRCSGGANWYAYVNNDPVNWRDPWGLTPSDAAGSGTGIAMDPAPRVLQTDPRIGVWLDGVNVMATNGCYFRSALGTVETEIGREMTPGEINRIRALSQASGLVQDDMGVVPGRTADVVNTAFRQVGSTVTASVVAYGLYRGPADASLIIGETVNENPHTREGDSRGLPTWDPYGAGNVKFMAGLEAVNYVYLKFHGG